jgi:hypothetical protein
MTFLRRAARITAVMALLAVAPSCRKKTEPGAPLASASASALAAPVASGLPIPADAVARVVNASNRPPYAGPTGVIRGVIRATGDDPPDAAEAVAQIPVDCEQGRAIYQKLFRLGQNREFADVLVAVTGYDAYVPERLPAKVVEARGCAWGARTFSLTFGQRLDVLAKDRRPYVPELVGGRMPAQIIAMPGGAASSLYPTSPGRYVLIDSMRIFATAEVYVLKYPTHAVTGIDGRYEITGVPPGELSLNAFSPQTGETVEKKLTLAGGQTLDLDLELPFNLAKYRESAAKAKSKSPPPPPAAASSP